MTTIISAINRRTFVKGLGAGVAAVAVPLILPSRIWAAGAAAPSNKFNIALVGCGGRGHGILEEAMRLCVNVIALCDVEARRIKDVRKLMSERLPESRTMME